MAEFTLATRKPSAASSGGGLSANKLSSGARFSSASISPNAGKIRYTSADIPQAVKDQTSDGIQHFMGVTAEAAFKFQDRESTYFANQSILYSEQQLEKLINGTVDQDGNSVPGYISTTGDNATKAFPALRERLEKTTADILQGLEPSVREKATMRIMASKNTALQIASKHRLSEFEKAEEALKYQQVKHLSASAAQDYRRLFTPDAFGKTIKDRIYGDIYSDPVKADKAWYGLMQGTLETIVNQAPNREQGLVVARDVFTGYMAKEMSGNLEALSNASKYIENTYMNNERFKWAQEDRADKMKSKADKSKWKTNELTIMKSTNEGEIMTPEELTNAYALGDISNGYFQQYSAEHHKGLYVHDHEYFLELRDKIIAGDEVSYENVAQSSRLGTQYKNSLLSLAEDATDPNFRDRFDTFYKTGQAAINRGSQFEFLNKEDRISNWETGLTSDLHLWISQDKTDTEIEKLIETKYSFKSLVGNSAVRLTPPGTEVSVRPDTHEEIQGYVDTVNSIPTEGDGFTITEEEKTLFVEAANQWHKILEESGIPQNKEERRSKLVQDELDKMKDSQEEPVTATGLTETMTKTLAPQLEGLNDEQKSRIISDHVEQQQKRTKRIEAVKQQDAERKVQAMENLFEDTDLAETEALLEMGLTDGPEATKFLTRMRKERKANLKSGLVLARVRRRRLVDEGASDEELENADNMISNYESMYDAELERQKELGKLSFLGGNDE